MLQWMGKLKSNVSEARSCLDMTLHHRGCLPALGAWSLRPCAKREARAEFLSRGINVFHFSIQNGFLFMSTLYALPDPPWFPDHPANNHPPRLHRIISIVNVHNCVLYMSHRLQPG
jgi:hypothetical protein